MALIGRFAFIIVGLLIAVGIRTYNNLLGPLPKPELDPNFYWGPGQPPLKEDTSIRPFKITYSAEDIDKLRNQLTDLSKIQDPLEGTAFEYGTNTNALKTIVQYWRDDYLPKWVEKHQVYLNQYPQFKTKIQGLDIHFIHIKRDQQSDGKKHYPLLLLHGWPGSIVEFYEFIVKLQNESVSFDIVVPSLVGYGFSQAASKVGMSSTDMSVVMRNLMIRLGYDKFIVQGGDWGSIIGSSLTTLYPENVIGYHSNLCYPITALRYLKTTIASFYPKAFMPEEFVDTIFPALPKLGGLIGESGYFHIQATKPDTIGVALSTNPIGLAAYILEKFAVGTNSKFLNLPDGGLTQYYTLDQLLHNLMFYYLPNAAHTAGRLYAESFSSRGRSYQIDRVPTQVPVGCARFRYEFGHVFDWAVQDKFPNLIHSTWHNDGGHFIAFQFPEVLVKDFLSFVRKLED